MDVEAATDLVWERTQQRRYYPPELKGQLSTPQAYRVQFGLLARYLAQGEVQAGWKVGLTAKAIQAQVGVHEPVLGFLLTSGARASGVAFRFDDLIRPAVENELCLTIGAPLQGPGVTMAQARAAITAAAPGLEVVEQRGDFAGDFNLSLVDNCQQKAFVTGEARLLAPDVRLGDSTVEVVLNGEVKEHASGREVMGDPAASVAWLANKLAEFERRIEPGMRIMSGSFTRQYFPARGDRLESCFTPFGAVRADFV